MKVFENIKQVDNYKEELLRVITDLIPLRSNRQATEHYYDTFLTADFLYKIWKDGRRDCELNNSLDINPKYKIFNLPSGAIPYQNAFDFRSVLLNVIADDRFSFGHLYWLLGSEQNRRAGSVIYHCVIPDDKIEYAIKFDIDEISKEIEAVNDMKERFKLVIKWKNESNRTKYTGELKAKFNECMESYLNSIEKEKQLFGYTKPDLVRSEADFVLPTDLNTNEAKVLLQIAIDKGLLNQDYSTTELTNTKAQKALLAEIISEKLNLNNKWKPFEILWNVEHLVQQRYDSKNKIGAVRGGDIIEQAFK